MSRLPALDRTNAGLFIGDLLVIFAVFSYGLRAHGVSVLDRPRYLFVTAGPYVLAWLFAGPASGLYARRVRDQWRSVVVSSVIAWTAVCVFGSVLRSTAVFPGSAPLVFVLVLIVVGLAVLLPWRVAVSFVATSERAKG